jgi:hypothetical protein
MSVSILEVALEGRKTAFTGGQPLKTVKSTAFFTLFHGYVDKIVKSQ